jgi:hypothetical protein
MGPCGGLGGLEAGVSEGHPVSSEVRVQALMSDSSLEVRAIEAQLHELFER